MSENQTEQCEATWQAVVGTDLDRLRIHCLRALGHQGEHWGRIEGEPRDGVITWRP